MAKSEAERLLNEFRSGRSVSNENKILNNQLEAQNLLKEFRSTKETTSSNNLSSGVAPLVQELKQSSSVNLIDRARLAFSAGDPDGQRRFLESKFRFVEQTGPDSFSAGNSINDIRPVDPEGFFGDALGEVVDKIDDAIVIGSQVLGSVKGGALGTAIAPGPGSVMGSMAGGASGAAAGQGIVSSIGQFLGVRGKSLEEEATDAAISGAFGAVGEGAGFALSRLMNVGRKSFIKKLGNIFDNSQADVGSEQALTGISRAFPKTFKITANVPEGATETVLKKGSDRVFTKFNMDPKNIAPLVSKIQKDIFEEKRILGNAVGRAKKQLFQKTGNKKIIDISNERNQILADLDEIGLLVNGKINQGFIDEKGSPAKSIFTKVLKLLDQTPDNKLTAQNALSLKSQLDDAVTKISGNSRRILNRFLGGSQSANGLRNQITNVAERITAKRFAQANRNFSTFAQALDDLTINFENPVSVQNFIKGFLNKGQVEKNLLRDLDAITKFPIMDNIENFAAAQAFTSASPNLLRLGAVAGLIGVSAADTPEGKILSLATGIGIGSPAGIREMIKLGNKIAKSKTIPLAIARKSKKRSPVSQAVERATLARILDANEKNDQE